VKEEDEGRRVREQGKRGRARAKAHDAAALSFLRALQARLGMECEGREMTYRAHDGSLPREHVVSRRSSGAGGRRVSSEIDQFLRREIRKREKRSASMFEV